MKLAEFMYTYLCVPISNVPFFFLIQYVDCKILITYETSLIIINETFHVPFSGQDFSYNEKLTNKSAHHNNLERELYAVAQEWMFETRMNEGYEHSQVSPRQAQISLRHIQHTFVQMGLKHVLLH